MSTRDKSLSLQSYPNMAKSLGKVKHTCGESYMVEIPLTFDFVQSRGYDCVVRIALSWGEELRESSTVYVVWNDAMMCGWIKFR